MVLLLQVQVRLGHYTVWTGKLSRLKVLASIKTVDVYQSAWLDFPEDLNFQHVHVFSWDCNW